MKHWTDNNAAPPHSQRTALRIALMFASAGLAVPAIGLVCKLGGLDQDGSGEDGVSGAGVIGGGGGVQGAAGLGRRMELNNGAQPPGQSIAAFCGRDDLPDFDVIALQRSWTHTSAADRAVIVDFVRRKLKAGGVFAVNYHCQPGWAPMAPVRSLLMQTASTLNAAGDDGGNDGSGSGDNSSSSSSELIDRTLDFADSLLDTDPAYFGAYPQVAERLQSLRTAHQPALVRDYFSHWQATSFADMADVLGEAKLTFACPADALDHIADLHLTRPQQALLAELSDQVFAESVRDLMVNRSVRADYWVKGARTLSPVQKLEAMRRPSVALAAPHASLAAGTAAPATAAPLRELAHLPHIQHLPLLPVLTLMADRQPRTIGALAAALQSQETALQQVFEAVLVLVGTGMLTL